MEWKTFDPPPDGPLKTDLATVETKPSQISLKAKNSELEKEVPVDKSYCDESLLIFDI